MMLYFGIIIIMNILSKIYYYTWVKALTVNDLAEKSFEIFTREGTVQCRPRDNLIDKIALSLDYIKGVISRKALFY